MQAKTKVDRYNRLVISGATQDTHVTFDRMPSMQTYDKQTNNT